jgi:hypothetical protein
MHIELMRVVAGMAVGVTGMVARVALPIRVMACAFLGRENPTGMWSLTCNQPDMVPPPGK